jgi:hypothetical protein
LALPHTFRPLGVRVVGYPLGGMLFVLLLVIWLAFPPQTRAEFSGPERGAALALVAAGLAIAYGLLRCRVVAREDGVTVVNGYRSHHYEWNQIVVVSLRSGSPWVTLDLSDGTTVSALGIQGSDGARAVVQVRQLRALVEQQTHTERDD